MWTTHRRAFDFGLAVGFCVFPFGAFRKCSLFDLAGRATYNKPKPSRKQKPQATATASALYDAFFKCATHARTLIAAAFATAFTPVQALGHREAHISYFSSGLLNRQFQCEFELATGS
jgi:hypothetical protein